MKNESNSSQQNSRTGSFARFSLRNGSSSVISPAGRTSRPLLSAARARSNAKKRMTEAREELDNVLHVLDSGVNRTPVSLQQQLQQQRQRLQQQQQNVSGLPSGKGYDFANNINNNSMILQSSMLFSTDMLNSSRVMLDSSFTSSSMFGIDCKGSFSHSANPNSL
uniref:Uncharacterized protein n=1 Tax=Lygus hesperus TaxID=30085 RepID=A0A146LCC0_LYGHE